MQSSLPFNFANSEAPRLERSTFKRNRAKKASFDAGYLIPMFLDEVLPGDIYTIRSTIFARLATLKTPIMDNMFIDMHYFYCPNRLLWEHWANFMGEKINPTDETEYVVPTIGGDPTYVDQGDLGDYFGLPTKKNIASDEQISAFPYRMYGLVWNEWFRDQNLQDPIAVDTDDGPDTMVTYPLQRRGKRYDFFTALLPWPQKGDAVSLPLGTTAPVIGDGFNMGFTAGALQNNAYLNFNNDTGFNGILGLRSANQAIGLAPAGGGVPTGDATLGLHTNPALSHVFADLAAATSATVNQWREAIAMQQYFELDARSGTRYTEILQAQWGQPQQDARLQRPEYLGGNTQRMGVTQVPQTSESGTTKQATLAAYGQTVSSYAFSKSFIEHGWIMGLVSVRADMTYQQGLNRMWSRETKFDFFHPVLAHLGEEAILRKEIFYDATTPANNAQVFGYGERWNEYRTALSDVAGLFRSNATGTLDFWHLATNFSSNPTFNGSFIQEDPPVDRVIAVPAEPHVIADFFHDVRNTRQIPTYSTPGLTRF